MDGIGARTASEGNSLDCVILSRRPMLTLVHLSIRPPAQHVPSKGILLRKAPREAVVQHLELVFQREDRNGPSEGHSSSMVTSVHRPPPRHLSRRSQCVRLQVQEGHGPRELAPRKRTRHHHVRGCCQDPVHDGRKRRAERLWDNYSESKISKTRNREKPREHPSPQSATVKHTFLNDTRCTCCSTEHSTVQNSVSPCP